MLWRGKESTEDDERRIDTSVSGLVRPWRLEDVRIALSRQFETKIALSPWSTSEQAKQADLFGSCGGMTVVGTHGIAVRYDSRRSPAGFVAKSCICGGVGDRNVTHGAGGLIRDSGLSKQRIQRAAGRRDTSSSRR